MVNLATQLFVTILGNSISNKCLHSLDCAKIHRGVQRVQLLLDSPAEVPY